MDFISVVILLGVFQGIFIGILLLTIKRGNKTANRLLGVLMILFSFSISGFELLRTNLYEKVPYLIGTPPTVIFLFGPFFLIYVKVLTNKQFKFYIKDLLHLIPFILMLIYRLPFFLKPAEEKLMVLQQHGGSMEGFVVQFIQIIHLFTYIFFVKRVIKQHVAKIKTTMSSIDKINLRWINIGTNAFIIIFGMMLIFTLLYFAGVNLYQYYMTILPVMVSLTIIIIGYLGLQQPVIFPQEVNNQKSKRYEKSTLSDQAADKYLSDLINAMEIKKLYLDNSLTLQKLADELDLPSYHLSQIINERLNQNFFDFINSYRVKEAKKLLTDPKGELLTILAVAEEVGFNSKSAFNAAFKKNSGMTPTEFKKNPGKK